jgi:hypothetical protein
MIVYSNVAFSVYSPDPLHRIKIRLIEVNAKCRYLKKETLRQVFFRVYRLEIANFFAYI